MKNVNIKPIIVFGSIVLVYFVAMLIIFGFDKESLNNKDNDPKPSNPNIDQPIINNDEPIKQEEIEDILFIEDGAIISKTATKWNSADADLLLNKKFSIYDNDVLIGNYTVLFNNDWYIYDDNNSRVNINNKILGINTTKSFNRYNLIEEEITEEDKNIVSEYLNGLGVSYDVNILLITKNTSDYNKDGIRESLYTVNLVNGLEEEYDYPEFSVAFINYLKQNQTLYKKTENVSCGINLYEYFELDNSKHLIFNCYYPSDNGYDVLLYSLNGMYSNLELQDHFE